MKYEPYHALINAIILQAVKDYRTALDDENAPQKSTPTEVERDLYKTLYEQILDKLAGGNTND